MPLQIFPSLISADILNLEHEIKKLELHCDGFHIDVMDWHFVPNLTWGPMFVNAIARTTNKPLCVHLVIEKSDEFLNLLTLRKNDTVSFHVEESRDIKNMIQRIKEKKLLANLAIKPKTPLKEIFPFVHSVDSILLMSVEPGFSGQSFLASSVDRLEELAHYRKEKNLSFNIIMDGGITVENIAMLAQNGVDSVSVAASIFGQKDPLRALKNLYGAARAR